MKKMLAFLLILTLLIIPFVSFAEESKDEAITPHFVYTQSTENRLFGLVDLPEDGSAYFVRATYYVPQGAYFILIVPVVNGEFCVWIFCRPSHITMELVDRQDAFRIGSYTVYDTIGIRFPDALYQDGW